MPIDVHAHYVPRRIVEVLQEQGRDYGIAVVEQPPGCHSLHFEHGVKIRPFFPRLIEPVAARVANMERQGVDRQILSIWADIFGYGLPVEKGAAWHRLMNRELGALCRSHPERFSWLASSPLQDAARAARELEHAVRDEGAIGGVVATNLDGVNLGELALDEFWAAAVELGVPVFLHPAQPNPTERTRRFALNQIAQYTFDTTLAVGSLVFAGVLDRFPTLELILSHGGGALPYLIGRFDCMHGRMDKAAQGDVAAAPPSHYLRRFHYDTILHHPGALRWLAEQVQTDRLVLGSDDSFPPADHDPMGSLRSAGFSAAVIRQIADENPRRLFRI